MDDKDLNSQYHGCWYPGDKRSQGISSNGTDLVIPENSGLGNRRVRYVSYFELKNYTCVSLSQLLHVIRSHHRDCW